MRFEYGVGRGNGGQNDNPYEDSNDKKPVICELVIVFSFFLSLFLSFSPFLPLLTAFSRRYFFASVILHQSCIRYMLTSNLAANHIPFVKVAGQMIFCINNSWLSALENMSCDIREYCVFIREPESSKFYSDLYIYNNPYIIWVISKRWWLLLMYYILKTMNWFHVLYLKWIY